MLRCHNSNIVDLASVSARNGRPTDEDCPPGFGSAQVVGRLFLDHRLSLDDRARPAHWMAPPVAGTEQLAGFKGLLAGLGMGLLFWLGIGALLFPPL